jgi:SAM-dependent methyltransferase
LSSTLCNLGAQPLANSYVPAAAAEQIDQRVPLRAVVCRDCRLVQLDHLANCEPIFGEYAYLSSMSSSFVAHAEKFVRRIQHDYAPRFVVELASNDGYLLQHFVRHETRCLGIEPATNVAALARLKGVETLDRFFGLQVAGEVAEAYGQADVIIANNVLAHVPDVNDFVAGMARLLAPRGTISVEFPHLVEMIRGLQFDTIYHEHYAYFSLLAFESLLARHGLAAVDVEKLGTHGGSLRVFIRHAVEGQAPSKAIGDLRIEERALGVPRDVFYSGFENAVAHILCEFRAYLAQAAERGENIIAYGAAAKGNTFLNSIGESAKMISCVADLSPFKQGHLLPGTHIPVVTPEEMIERQPDAVLVLPWNIAPEIESTLLRLGLRGRKMITAIPRLTVKVLGS